MAAIPKKLLCKTLGQRKSMAAIPKNLIYKVTSNFKLDKNVAGPDLDKTGYVLVQKRHFERSF